MSVENLKALAHGFRVEHGDSTITGMRCLHCVLVEAQREIQSIEEAAKSIVAQDARRALSEDERQAARKAMVLLESIAKEAK